MMRRSLVCGMLLMGCSVFVFAEEKSNNPPKAPTNAGMEKMKSLVGTWVTADKDGKPTDEVVSVIKLTAAGSAVEETLFPGQPHEMVSIYVADGSDLLMTHYCMLGNQPQMKAKAKAPSNKLVFEFVGGSNLDPKKDKHMHSAVVTFVDNDHYEMEGVGWDEGGPAKEMCNGMKLVRKK